MKGKVRGFDWDDGNWSKCGKHGVSKAEIEFVIRHALFVVDDPHPFEKRYRTALRADTGRYVFVAFSLRQKDGFHQIRPISARFMHDKEIKSYETQMARISIR